MQDINNNNKNKIIPKLDNMGEKCSVKSIHILTLGKCVDKQILVGAKKNFTKKSLNNFL